MKIFLFSFNRFTRWYCSTWFNLWWRLSDLLWASYHIAPWTLPNLTIFFPYERCRGVELGTTAACALHTVPLRYLIHDVLVFYPLPVNEWCITKLISIPSRHGVCYAAWGGGGERGGRIFTPPCKVWEGECFILHMW